ncbi:MAG: lipoate--protein ligase family protein, partial [Halobacteriota archaeon]
MTIRVIRGRRASIDADRNAVEAMLAYTARTGTPTVRVWTPHRQLAFGRRDTHAPGYERARKAAVDLGFPPVERSVGGRAVAYTGDGLAFARTIAIDDLRCGMADRYASTTESVIAALESVGASVAAGEPPRSYCPGDHSIRGDPAATDTGKIVGIAQRITAGAALVSGSLTVSLSDTDEIATVLQPVYDALAVPFD